MQCGKKPAEQTVFSYGCLHLWPYRFPALPLLGAAGEIFPEKIFPFKTEEAKLKPDDFIAREEIEMGFFITGLLEDMK